MNQDDRAKKSGRCFLGCLMAGVILFVLIGGIAYIVLPKILKDADKKVLPWLEKKGRVLIGKMSLEPLEKTIEHSDLTGEEKEKWKTFLGEKWELAAESHDQQLQREVLIEYSRETVRSYAGLYYALKAAGTRSFSETSLTPSQISEGKGLIPETAGNLKNGIYAEEELLMVGENIYSVIMGLNISSDNEEGRWEKDKNVRDFFRALHALKQTQSHLGDKQERDMNAEFQKELETLKQKVLSAERRQSERP